jgi:hypothetical protein
LDGGMDDGWMDAVKTEGRIAWFSSAAAKANCEIDTASQPAITSQHTEDRHTQANTPARTNGRTDGRGPKHDDDDRRKKTTDEVRVFSVCVAVGRAGAGKQKEPHTA